MSTQNVNVARFARNVAWEFFCDFQTSWIKAGKKPDLQKYFKVSFISIQLLFFVRELKEFVRQGVFLLSRLGRK